MAQHLPAGKLVKARHLQQLWIYAADAVTEVDHHSWNCGCGHDEDARLSVKSKPHQCQNHPAYGRNGLEHMDQWGSHILYLGTQAKQQPQNSANAHTDGQTGNQPQDRCSYGGSEIRLRHQPNQCRKNLGNGGHHQRREKERCQLPGSQQQAHSRGTAEPQSRLTLHRTAPHRAAFHRS